MVDQERVCCLCGDVGFPDKLFRCSGCRFRFQHSYCSNYNYGSESSSSPSSTTMKQICDWCQSEGRNSSSNRLGSRRERENHHIRSEYASGEGIKQHETTTLAERMSISSKNSGSSSGVPSPRQGTHRRYKLLKDVMC